MSDDIPETVFRPLLQHLMEVQEAERLKPHNHETDKAQRPGTCPACDVLYAEHWKLQQREVAES